MHSAFSEESDYQIKYWFLLILYSIGITEVCTVPANEPVHSSVIWTRTEQSLILKAPSHSLCIKVMASVLLAGGKKRGVIRR